MGIIRSELPDMAAACAASNEVADMPLIGLNHAVYALQAGLMFEMASMLAKILENVSPISLSDAAEAMEGGTVSMYRAVAAANAKMRSAGVDRVSSVDQANNMANAFDAAIGSGLDVNVEYPAALKAMIDNIRPN